MTTTAVVVQSDTLDQAAEQVASTVEGTETPASEAPAPSYVTSEDVTRLITEADDRSSRRWQGIADTQIAAANRKADEQVAQLRKDMELTNRQREEAQILALPEEEQGAAWGKLAYQRANEAKDAANSPQTVAPRDAVALSGTQNEAMVNRVVTEAQAIAAQAGVTIHDMRLWVNTDTNLSEQENLTIIRRNADGIKPQAPAPANGTPTPAPTTTNTTPPAQTREPEPVPIRNSPAAATGQQTDEEIQAAVIARPQDPAVHTAYREMMTRRQLEG